MSEHRGVPGPAQCSPPLQGAPTESRSLGQLASSSFGPFAQLSCYLLTEFSHPTAVLASASGGTPPETGALKVTKGLKVSVPLKWMQPPVCKPVPQAVRLGHEFRGQKDLGSNSSGTCRLTEGPAILPSKSPYTRIKK